MRRRPLIVSPAAVVADPKLQPADGDGLPEVIIRALLAGYRHIDTAAACRNGAGVGVAVSDADMEEIGRRGAGKRIGPDPDVFIRS